MNKDYEAAREAVAQLIYLGALNQVKYNIVADNILQHPMIGVIASEQPNINNDFWPKRPYNGRGWRKLVEKEEER